MMRTIMLLSITLSLSACGGTSSEQTKGISTDEETEIVETITSDLETAKEELKIETKESLDEIDSLLQNIE